MFRLALWDLKDCQGFILRTFAKQNCQNGVPVTGTPFRVRPSVFFIALALPFTRPLLARRACFCSCSANLNSFHTLSHALLLRKSDASLNELTLAKLAGVQRVQKRKLAKRKFKFKFAEQEQKQEIAG